MDTANKILLIEDDSTICSALSYALSQNGYEVMTCMFLREATGLLNSYTFDLIICDVGLPDGNGLDFCSKYQQIPFISMSASECSEFAEANGAKAFIEKPFLVEDMLDAVKLYCSI